MEFTTEQLTNLAKHLRERYYEIKKDGETPHDLLTCVHQIETIRNTPFMLKDVLTMVQWNIAGEPLTELPLKINKNTDLITLEITKWRLENGI